MINREIMRAKVHNIQKKLDIKYGLFPKKTLKKVINNERLHELRLVNIDEMDYNSIVMEDFMMQESDKT